jgi:hypothetical protein
MARQSLAGGGFRGRRFSRALRPKYILAYSECIQTLHSPTVPPKCSSVRDVGHSVMQRQQRQQPVLRVEVELPSFCTAPHRTATPPQHKTKSNKNDGRL